MRNVAKILTILDAVAAVFACGWLTPSIELGRGRCPGGLFWSPPCVIAGIRPFGNKPVTRRDDLGLAAGAVLVGGIAEIITFIVMAPSSLT